MMEHGRFRVREYALIHIKSLKGSLLGENFQEREEDRRRVQEAKGQGEETARLCGEK